MRRVTLGAALRAHAAAADREHAEQSLAKAIGLLEPTPACYELALMLADFGAHLRRTGRRGDARVPLRRALDLAQRTGAVPLAPSGSGENCSPPAHGPAHRAHRPGRTHLRRTAGRQASPRTAYRIRGQNGGYMRLRHASLSHQVIKLAATGQLDMAASGWLAVVSGARDL